MITLKYIDENIVSDLKTYGIIIIYLCNIIEYKTLNPKTKKKNSRYKDT